MADEDDMSSGDHDQGGEYVCNFCNKVTPTHPISFLFFSFLFFLSFFFFLSSGFSITIMIIIIIIIIIIIMGA